MKKHLRWLRYVFLLVGAALLFLLIQKIGINSIVGSIRDIGWNFALLLVIHFSWYSCYTLSWMQFLKQFEKRPHFWELFRIKLAGESVNALTPINFLGGDPLRIYLLQHHITSTKGAASVVVDRTLHFMATMSVVAIGICCSLALLDEQTALIRFGFPALILGLMLVVGALFFQQRNGFFTAILGLLQRIKIKRAYDPKVAEKANELDLYISEFYRKNHKAFFLAFLFHVFGRVLGIVEVYVIGKTLSSNFNFFIALVLTAVAPMVNAIFTFIPGALGIMEGVYSGLMYVVGLNPAIGIAIQVTKRVRAGFWIGLGSLCLNKQQRKKILHQKNI